MSKQLSFTYGDKEYTLEFTRKSVETMERQGFVAEDIRTKPMLTLPALFMVLSLLTIVLSRKKRLMKSLRK